MKYLPYLAALALLAACSSSSGSSGGGHGTQGGDGGEPALNGSGDSGSDFDAAVESCQTVISYFSDSASYEPDVSGAPTGFPSAPASATLCGSLAAPTPDRMSVEVTGVYLPGNPGDAGMVDILQYYSQALTALGYSVQAPESDFPGRTSMDFIAPEPTDGGLSLGGRIIWADATSDGTTPIPAYFDVVYPSPL